MLENISYALLFFGASVLQNCQAGYNYEDEWSSSALPASMGPRCCKIFSPCAVLQIQSEVSWQCSLWRDWTDFTDFFRNPIKKHLVKNISIVSASPPEPVF